MNWFTADTHFRHWNCVRYDGRPFESIKEHDDWIVNEWNEWINKDDTVYHLGDFCFGNLKWIDEYIDRLNGKIHLIRGNHDHKNIQKCKFESVSDRKLVSINGQLIVLDHYAMRVWPKSHYGSWHLFGHSHGNLPEDPNSLSFNVSINDTEYRPVSYDYVKDRMEKKIEKEKTLELKEKYPIFLQLAYKEPDEGEMFYDIQKWGIYTASGWDNIIQVYAAVCEDYNKKNPDDHVYAQQIKEKLGTLRLHTNKIPEKLWYAWQAMEAISEFTCQECGKQGRLRNDRSWILTLCDDCNSTV